MNRPFDGVFFGKMLLDSDLWSGFFGWIVRFLL